MSDFSEGWGFPARELDPDRFRLSLSLPVAFACVFALTVASRLAWFRVIDRRHRRGVGV